MGNIKLLKIIGGTGEYLHAHKVGKDVVNRIQKALPKRKHNICRVYYYYYIIHYTSVQTHRIYITTSEPLGKLQTLGDYNVSMYVHP